MAPRLPRDPGLPSSPLLAGPLAALALLIVALPFRYHEMVGESAADFIVVTLFLGGGAAWLTGKAVARGWGPLWHLVVYGLLLAAAVRFCHFALFGDALIDPEPAAAEAVFLVSLAALGFRSVRRRQMTVQYGWMFEPAGRLSWRRRTPGQSTRA